MTYNIPGLRKVVLHSDTGKGDSEGGGLTYFILVSDQMSSKVGRRVAGK